MRTNHAGVTEVARFRGDDEAYRENYERIFGRKGLPSSEEITPDTKAEAVAEEIFEEKRKSLLAKRLCVLKKLLHLAASEYLGEDEITILEEMRDEYQKEISG